MILLPSDKLRPHPQFLWFTLPVNKGAHITADETLTLAQRAVMAVIRLYTGLIAGTINDSAKMLRLSRDMARAVRRSLKDYRQIHRSFLRAELASNPKLRAQVYQDLGGARAMAAWQARQHGQKIRAQFRAARKAQGQPIQDDYFNNQASTSSLHPHKPRKIWTPTTDRHGYFRLAAIPTGPRKSKSKSTVKSRPAKRRVKNVRQWRFDPIQIAPRQLKPIDNYLGSGFEKPSVLTPQGTTHAPPIIPTPD